MKTQLASQVRPPLGFAALTVFLFFCALQAVGLAGVDRAPLIEKWNPATGERKWFDASGVGKLDEVEEGKAFAEFLSKKSDTLEREENLLAAGPAPAARAVTEPQDVYVLPAPAQQRSVQVTITLPPPQIPAPMVLVPRYQYVTVPVTYVPVGYPYVYVAPASVYYSGVQYFPTVYTFYGGSYYTLFP